MATNLPPVEDPPDPPPDQVPDQLLVAVYEDGKIALNLKEGADAEIMADLRRRVFNKKKTVFIDAAPKANYARVIEVASHVTHHANVAIEDVANRHHTNRHHAFLQFSSIPFKLN